jgi:steroid delta-isomerase-like uncharacterized protein
MSASANRETFLRFYNVISTGDGDQINATIDEVVDPDVVPHTPLKVESSGAQGIKDRLAMLRQAFPDLDITVHDVVAEGDRVAARTTVTGTHKGNHMGLAPTGKSFEMDEMIVCRFSDDGRIVETWSVVDVLTQMRQLGALPPEPEHAPQAAS